MTHCPDCGEEIAERDFPAAPWWGTKCRCFAPDPNAALEGHPCPMCGSEEHLSCPGTERRVRPRAKTTIPAKISREGIDL